MSEQNMQPRPADQAAIDALKGDQPAGTGDGKAGAGKYEATSLAPSATWDVSAHTGDFNWNYPLRVPPVPGALQPELSLSYSSGTLDGLTSATNTQAPWVGDGWSMWPGFIERSYGSCADDLPGDADDKPADLCWRSDNATLSYGGSGSALIKDDVTGVWRPENDDGSRIERLTGAANGDNDGEHWKVTDVDGVQYFYGSRTESKSTWTVPVFGDDLGEPCHASDFAASSCTQGYRWNLDKVVDPALAENSSAQVGAGVPASRILSATARADSRVTGDRRGMMIDRAAATGVPGCNEHVRHAAPATDE
ncbi:hypothetical protein [Saccharopolyspora shandongensis]|uniref:hypothetical protein n=1 Tax=Saccharopolyspora shandongensis TaxID=418495 RepID=UPI0033CAF2D4